MGQTDQEKWYFNDHDEIHGPYLQEDLIIARSLGMVTPESWISRSAQGPFVQYRSVFKDFPVVPAEILEHHGNEIKFSCSSCGQHYVIETPQNSPWRVVCRHCRAVIELKVPERSEPPAATPPPEKKNELGKKTAAFHPAEIPNGSICCPHCWKSFPPEYMMYISRHPSLLGDPVLGEMAQKRFTPTLFNNRGLPLDEMGEVAMDMACPRCRLKIPSTLFDLPARFFSIVGTPSSGKTYYLTTLLHLIRGMAGKEFNSTLLDVDPQLNATLDNCEKKLFFSPEPHRFVALDKTQQTGLGISNRVRLNDIPVDLPNPFLFELAPKSSREEEKGTNLVFYDNAGEHFVPGADSLSNPATLHLGNSDGIIFLFDPLADAGMRRQCDPGDPQMRSVGKVTDQGVIFSEMIRRLRAMRGLSATEKCPVPLVVALAKCDTLKLPFALEKFSGILSCANGRKMLRRELIGELSLATREFLYPYAGTLIDAAEACFEQVVFIPVSNFGRPARQLEENGGNGPIGIIPAEIRPQLVELPLLWLFGELGLIGNDLSEDGSLPLLEGCSCDGESLLLPGSGERLPLNYAGSIITINGNRSRLPRFSNGKRSGRGGPENIWS